MKYPSASFVCQKHDAKSCKYLIQETLATIMAEKNALQLMPGKNTANQSNLALVHAKFLVRNTARRS